MYAKTKEECETLLPGLIEKMKAEIKTIKQSGDLATVPGGISKKKKLIAAYMRQHPKVTNKSLIAREVGVDKNTVRRYYEEIRKIGSFMESATAANTPEYPDPPEENGAR